MRLDPAHVRQQIENLKLLFPDIFDEESWLLSLESETDLMSLLDQVVDRMREAASMAGGIAGRIAELEIRQGRFVAREQAMRVLAYKLMTAADLRKAELQEATLSIRNGTPKVIVTDETAVPDDYCKIVKSPDKTKIKELLTTPNGSPVSWALMSNGEPTLAVRTK